MQSQHKDDEHFQIASLAADFMLASLHPGHGTVWTTKIIGIWTWNKVVSLVYSTCNRNNEFLLYSHNAFGHRTFTKPHNKKSTKKWTWNSMVLDHRY